MLGGIAGQGGFDSKGKTPMISYNTTGSTSYVNLLSISGSGYLTGISGDSGNGLVTLKITIDGVALTEILVSSHNYTIFFSLPMIFRFESSLLIQGKVATDVLKFNASYLLD